MRGQGHRIQVRAVRQGHPAREPRPHARRGAEEVRTGFPCPARSAGSRRTGSLWPQGVPRLPRLRPSADLERRLSDRPHRATPRHGHGQRVFQDGGLRSRGSGACPPAGFQGASGYGHLRRRGRRLRLQPLQDDERMVPPHGRHGKHPLRHSQQAGRGRHGTPACGDHGGLCDRGSGVQGAGPRRTLHLRRGPVPVQHGGGHERQKDRGSH